MTDSARDRLLAAAAALMDASGARKLSTRAVCEAAGVTAPTLYHHFGSRQGLIDAVVEHGFTQYVDMPADDLDALDAVRLGWDRHVAFGLDHPRFYTLLYGELKPGVPCAITGVAVERLEALLRVAARDGRLAVGPGEAALQLHAACVGVTLTLIGTLSDAVDATLSARVRESALAGVLAVSAPRGGPRPAAALHLRALLEDDPAGLSPGEAALMRELLGRLSG